MRIDRGGAADAARLIALFDDAVAWLVAAGQTGQWRTEPFSARVERMAGRDPRARGAVASPAWTTTTARWSRR